MQSFYEGKLGFILSNNRSTCCHVSMVTQGGMFIAVQSTLHRRLALALSPASKYRAQNLWLSTPLVTVSYTHAHIHTRTHTLEKARTKAYTLGHAHLR